MDKFDKEIKRWLYLEEEIPRKMLQEVVNQKQLSIGRADDRLGSGAAD